MPGAMFRAEVDEITASEWYRNLASFEDANIYQTWSYGAVRWGERNLSHLLLKRGDDTVAMAQLVIIRPLRLRAGMAYLRWGPLCHRKDRRLDAEVMREMAVALRKEYVIKRGLFLRVLPRAYLESPRALMLQSAFSQFASAPFRAGESYRTFDIDLTQPLEGLRRMLSQNWRRHLNRAERNSLVINEDAGVDCFPVFIKLFNEMVARKKIEIGYDVAEFERMQRQLPIGHRMRVFICEQQGLPIAGAVGSAMGDTGIYLLGATSDRGLKADGAYLVHWRMIQWLKQTGVTNYDLGGINPETNPGVYQFKHGLSGNDVRYMTPLASCDNIASKVVARALDLAGGRARRTLRRLFVRRAA